MNTFVIIGAGVGGLVVSNILEKKLKNSKTILFDKNKEYTFTPSLLWMLTGNRKLNEIQRPYSRLNRKKIQFINEDVKQIDFENKIVKTSDSEVEYDYLVLSPGAAYYLERLKGFKEFALNLYEISGVEKIHSQTLETKISNVYALGDVIFIPLSSGKPLPKAGVFAHSLKQIYFSKIFRGFGIGEKFYSKSGGCGNGFKILI